MHRNHGFTLLEILLALFIFTLVAMITTSALHTAIRAQNDTQQNAKKLAELEIVFTFFSRDIEQAIDRPVTLPNGAIEDSFKGAPDSITFTHAGVANPGGQVLRSTLERVRYRLDKTNLIRETWESLDQTQDTQIQERILLKNVDDLAFQFLDKNGNFQTRWPPPTDADKTPLPKAVRVILTIHNSGNITQFYLTPS